MKKFLVILLSILCLLSSAFGDTHTSVGDGLWSAAATWNPAAVPADGDTVNIDTSGEDIIFDVDQSAFAGLAGLTIASGASLTASTNAGAYVLKMNGNLTVSGTLQAGTSVAVPYPSTCSFKINFSSAAYIISVGSTGKLYLYCTQPTNRWIKLSAAELSGQTILSVDTDVTGDIWADGDLLRLDDINNGQDTQECTIDVGGIAATTITVTAGTALNSDYVQYAKVILCTRNIQIINSTAGSGVIQFNASASGSYVACLIDNCSNGIYRLRGEFAGVISGGTNGVSEDLNGTISGILTGQTNIGLNGCTGTTVSGLVSGCYYATSTAYSTTISGEISGCAYGLYQTFSCILSGTMTGCGTGVDTSSNFAMTSTAVINGFSIFLYRQSGAVLNGTFSNGGTIVYWGSGITIRYVSSSCTNDLFQVGDVKAYNTTFGATNEFSGYNSTARTQYNYAESFDHDQVTNAYKAWCKGGIVTSQTASPPTTETRYAVYYQHACETNLYPTFHHYLTTVSPGAAIEVEGYIQIPAIDLTSYPPKLQIIDAFADPLVDSTQTALDQDQPASVDGTVTTWQPVDVIWANTGDSPRQVYVRMIAYSHDVSTHNINMVWSVASYQDQIAALYDSFIPIRTDVATADTPTSFTLTGGQAATNAYRYNTIAIQDATDGHWEQRKILNWTSGRVTTVDHAFSFTPAAGDLANILSVGYGEDDLIIAGTVPDATSTANSIKLGANASSTNDIYNENLIVLTGGTGAGQARLITDYFGATKRAAVRNPWVITPDATTTYRIAPFSGILLANTGVCDGGTANSITLRTPAPATADLYNGHTIFLSGGTGMGQARLITDYSAALVATVTPNWDITPVVDDTVYIVLPVGLGTIYSDITAIKAVTDIMEAVNSTVSVVGDANSFTIANTGDINDVNDAYNGMTVYVEDATTGDWEDRLIDNWETGRVVTVDADFTFTPEVGDRVVIWGTSYFPMSVYNGLPLPPEGETITVDRRVAPTGGTIGGTRTLDAEGDDPPR